MTQEVRVNVDASFYKRPGELGLLCTKEKYERAIADRVSDMIRATHKFINVQVDFVPHDNDRDYTEEDAEKHLNGEKRKTYADDFFEKFPNAPRVGIGLRRDESVPAIYFWDIYGIAEAEKYDPNILRVMEDSFIMAGVSNGLWLKEKPEDTDA